MKSLWLERHPDIPQAISLRGVPLARGTLAANFGQKSPGWPDPSMHPRLQFAFSAAEHPPAAAAPAPPAASHLIKRCLSFAEDVSGLVSTRSTRMLISSSERAPRARSCTAGKQRGQIIDCSFTRGTGRSPLTRSRPGGSPPPCPSLLISLCYCVRLRRSWGGKRVVSPVSCQAVVPFHVQACISGRGVRRAAAGSLPSAWRGSCGRDSVLCETRAAHCPGYWQWL